MHNPVRVAVATAGVAFALLLGTGAHSLAASGHVPTHQSRVHLTDDGPPCKSPGCLSGNVARPSHGPQD
ncbi:MAG TPA: hypothetical protein VHW64_11690 [Nocardioides sp.]|jgi:hypothetical protein|uniref:hypothetical protein n=1 Tax=Nocardioides sp. TaxID=35761 RepID=UPI002E300ED9|nr:hypothetical protein [Nocardioides sp.]HEX3931362.1 hypothetical protein [Nocardioides sp.]